MSPGLDDERLLALFRMAGQRAVGEPEAVRLVNDGHDAARRHDQQRPGSQEHEDRPTLDNWRVGGKDLGPHARVRRPLPETGHRSIPGGGSSNVFGVAVVSEA